MPVILPRPLSPAMAVEAAPALVPDGPRQTGRGAHGQYVYWITMSHPRPETVQQLGLRTPAEFDRQTFRELVVTCHERARVEIVETACFIEPHANGLPHLNLLVRSRTQYKWRDVAVELAKEKVHVDFGHNVNTWVDGVVYGRVPSEHKGAEKLDQNPVQWVKEGVPVPLDEFLPARFRQPGFVRKTRMSPLSFFDACQEHGFSTYEQVLAKATELSDAGDRALLSFLLENDGEAHFAKVQRAAEAKERVRRAGLAREALLEEYFQNNACVCDEDGKCYRLMKDLLRRNGLDGRLQKEVYEALRVGRAKKRNVCLVGDTDSGKSFMFKGLKEVFYAYERPDGGTYQLEDILDKELVLLNDFEYDKEAKAWMPWGYFKNFTEGASKIPVARPKNRGGNTQFDSSAPVLMTAPQRVTLRRYGQVDENESKQMDRRILYLPFNCQLREEERQEVTRHCGFCAAKLYLEGKGQQQAAAAAPDDGDAPQEGPAGAPQQAPKRRRTVQECIHELRDLKVLLDSGALDEAEFTALKSRLLEGD